MDALILVQPTIDHVFLGADDNKQYLFSRGGGSSGNIAANLSSSGLDVSVCGTSGHDIWSEFFYKELELLRCKLLLTKRTGFKPMHIEQLLKPSPTEKGAYDHEFRWLSGSTALSKFEIDSEIKMNGGYFVATSCGEGATTLARSLRATNTIAALDLGRSAYLRFFSATRLASALSAFDIVLMPVAVFETICRRLWIDNTDRLLKLSKALPGQVLIISNGPRPITLVDLRVEAEVMVASPFQGEVVESSGAGDALLSEVIRDLWTKGIRTRSDLSRLSFSMLEAVLNDSVPRLASVLSVFGARGHIDNRTPSPLAHLEGSFDVELNLEANRPTRGPSVKKVELNLTDLNARVGAERGIRLAESTVGKVVSKALVDWLGDGRLVALVGTGGSYSVACVIGGCIGARATSIPMRPRELISSTIAFDRVLFITYSGRTPDCVSAAEALIRKRHYDRNQLMVLTAARESEVHPTLCRIGVVASYWSEGMKREKGFISFFATIGPSMLSVLAFRGFEAAFAIASLQLERSRDQEKVEKASALIARSDVLHIIYDSKVWPAAVDIESKFCEGGLMPVILHESKDFSHGRFMSLVGRQSYALILQASHRWDYQSALVRVVRDILGEDNVLVVRSGLESPEATLDLLLHSHLIVKAVAKRLGIDISRPTRGGRLPSGALELYKWIEKSDTD